MRAEQQYIDLYAQCEGMIAQHSAAVLNAPRAEAFSHFQQLGFPTRKLEKYKYTDIQKMFEPDFGLNLNRLEIPVNPYEVFKCDVPNMSTLLYFVQNDEFYNKVLPKVELPEGVLLGSLKEMALQHPELVAKHYGKLADTSKDG
ncbi:MAG: Fe-S cluster assembly protein SufD, partial [Phocaeicola sp.]